jgi:hypothetical protein
MTLLFCSVRLHRRFPKKDRFMNKNHKAAGRVVACVASTGRLARRLSTPLLALALVASPVFAQSGDVSGVTANFTTLGSSILRLVVALAGFAFVGLIIWGGLTLATNRPRGLAMIGGGMVGALLSGLAFILVNTLTGQNVVSMLLVHVPAAVYLS